MRLSPRDDFSDEGLDHFLACRSAVDVVAHEHHTSVLEVGGPTECKAERLDATMHVADNDQTHLNALERWERQRRVIELSAA